MKHDFISHTFIKISYVMSEPLKVKRIDLNSFTANNEYTVFFYKNSFYKNHKAQNREILKLFKNHTEPQIWTKYGFVEKATNFCFSFWFYVCEEV